MSTSDTKLKFPFGEIFEIAGNQHLAPSPKKNHHRRRRSRPATRKACHQGTIHVAENEINESTRAGSSNSGIPHHSHMGN